MGHYRSYIRFKRWNSQHPDPFLRLPGQSVVFKQRAVLHWRFLPCCVVFRALTPPSDKVGWKRELTELGCKIGLSAILAKKYICDQNWTMCRGTSYLLFGLNAEAGWGNPSGMNKSRCQPDEGRLSRNFRAMSYGFSGSSSRHTFFGILLYQRNLTSPRSNLAVLATKWERNGVFPALVREIKGGWGHTKRQKYVFLAV